MLAGVEQHVASPAPAITEGRLGAPGRRAPPFPLASGQAQLLPCPYQGVVLGQGEELELPLPEQPAERPELGDTAAHGLAEQRIAEVRSEADQQVRQARAELEIAEATITRMEAEADQAAQQLNAVQGQLVEARTALEEARTAARIAEARTAEQGRQIADLQRQVAQNRDELEAARAQAIDQARLSGELAALRQQLQDQAALIARLSTR